MHWIIQDKVFGEETDELIKYCSSYELVEHGCKKFSCPGPYIVRGTTQFIENIYGMWGNFCNIPDLLTLENYECSNYYLEVENLLNDHFVMLPWWKLYHSEDLLRRTFPDFERLFIRPNSGQKRFTGTTIGFKWWEKELEIIAELPSSDNLINTDLVLVAPARKVWNEVRFLMCENKIVSASAYGDNEVEFSEGVYPDYCNMVEANNYFPDTFYTIDIGMTELGPKIIELNSFVSAGLYDIDYKKVVKSVEEFCAN